MSTINCDIYGVTVRGAHPDFVFKRYFGLAESIEEAMHMVQNQAILEGWNHIELDDISKIGPIDFCPEYRKNQSEVEKCQQ